MKKSNAKSCECGKLTADQLRQVYKQDLKGLLRVLNSRPELVSSIRHLLPKAKVAATSFLKDSGCFASMSGGGGFSRVGAAPLALFAASKEDSSPSASAPAPASRPRSVSVPMMLAPMSAKHIFVQALHTKWWPEIVIPEAVGSQGSQGVKKLTYEQYYGRKMGALSFTQNRDWLNVVCKAKNKFIKNNQPSIDKLEKVNLFMQSLLITD